MQTEPARTQTVLEEAQGLIYGDRAQDYGPPTESFNDIASYWTTYVNRLIAQQAHHGGGGISLSATDVSHMMLLLKISRNTTGGYKRDTVVDMAGYAGCIERVVENK